MNYIVYKTINFSEKIDDNYCEYIGVHQEENLNKLSSYIGCGIFSTQPSTYKNPSTKFQKAVAKYGPESFKREILFIFDNIDNAYKKEEELVTQEYLNLPYVYNMVLGGKFGVAKSNYNLNCLPIYKFDIKGNIVKYYNTTLEAANDCCTTIKKLEDAISGGYIHKEYYWSRLETIDVNIRPKDHRRFTYLYDCNGYYINEFISRTNCARYLKCSPQSISKAITKKSIIKNHYVSDKLVDKFIPVIRKSLKDSIIYLYDINNNYLGKYIGKQLFPRIQLFSYNKLYSAIYSNNGWYKDYYLSLEKIDKVPSKIHYDMKKISVYTKDNKFIEELESITAARKKYNIATITMNQFLWGMKEHKQYIFRYSK